MDVFDEWVHFRKAVRIRDASSLENLAENEEQLWCWAETEQVSELFERRSLILYKLYELEEEQEQAATRKLAQQDELIEEIVWTAENVDDIETDSEQEQLKHRDEAIDFLDSEDDVGSSQANRQQVSVSCPPASLTVDVKLQEVKQVVVSLDSRVKSMDSQMQSINSQYVQACLLLEDGQNHNQRHFLPDSVETNLVRHLTAQQYQFTNDLDFVKLQLLKLVNNLKENGDAKKVEGGQHRNLEGGQHRNLEGGKGPSGLSPG
ncbi:hypothetical protein F511_09080 [Dorcoceras hygrometricum]|nr:hypothetical protein F511_09080 [Dorcoceras hygrometricum]